jgi:hypothetical protein
MPTAFNLCFEHTQQNTCVCVHGPHIHMQAQPHTHQHFSFCVVILLGNATNYNTGQKKYNTLDNISEIPLIPGSPVKI